MLDSAGDLGFVPSTAAPLTATESESCSTVEALEELLCQSIHLRDLYRNARGQTCDGQHHQLRPLFDAHYKEQVRIVDVLIDRMRTLGGAGRVFARDLLQRTQPCQSLRGRASITRFLRELLDAHDLVLSAALPTGTSDGQCERSWTRDFAVGHVVLTNEQQCLAISEQLMDSETKRGLQSHASLLGDSE